MKNSFFLSTMVITLVTVLLTGCSATSNQNSTEPSGSSSPDAKNSSEVVALETTSQYEEAFIHLAGSIPTGTEHFSREEVLTASWTAREYVFAALEDPYLISGYWGSKDDYRASGVEGVTTYLSGEAKSSFQENSEVLRTVGSVEEKATALSALNQLIFLPTSNTELSLDSTCYDKWEIGSCRKDEVMISNVAIADDEENVIITLQAKVTPLFNGYEGVVIEPRVYNYQFKLNLDTLPSSNDTQVPIFTINSIDGSLVINPTEKFI